MSYRTDIAVYGADGALKLLVEAKVKQNASAEWAKKLLRNMYAHGQLPRVPYFLLALPEQWYLWRNVSAQDATNAPDPEYLIDPRPFLRKHLDKLNPTQDAPLEGQHGHRVLEWAMAGWLDGVVRSDSMALPIEAAEWLTGSGLLDAINGGRVEVEALVG